MQHSDTGKTHAHSQFRIYLHGPPGIGKSTLVRAVNTTMPGSALDLEELSPGLRRHWVERASTNARPQPFMIGVADQTRSLIESQPFALHVLLALEQADYQERRRRRDFADESKAAQVDHDITSWKRAWLEYAEAASPPAWFPIVNASGRTIDVLERIAAATRALRTAMEPK